MKRILTLWMALVMMFSLIACAGQTDGEGTSPSSLGGESNNHGGPLQVNTTPTPGITVSPETPAAEDTLQEETEMKLQVQVGGSTFTATLESNAAVDAFVEMMREVPVVIEMSDYSGFEKVGSLGASLPTSNSQTITRAGDIVLYNGNQIVIFYGSNSWSYTRLARIDDLTGWEDALGNGDVAVTFSIGG